MPDLSDKVFNLFEELNVRPGVILLGPACSGKTTCYQILQHCLTELRSEGARDIRFQEVTTHVLNP